MYLYSGFRQLLLVKAILIHLSFLLFFLALVDHRY